MNKEERKLAVFKMHRCFRCLKGGHRATHCRADKCACGYNHHHLLCGRVGSRQQVHHVAEGPPHWEDVMPTEEDLPGAAAHIGWRMPQGNPLRQPDPVVVGVECAQERSLVINSLNSAKRDEAVSLRYVVVHVRNPLNGHWMKVAALLDDGSNVSLISENLVNKLGLAGVRKEMQIGGIGGKVISHQTCHTNVQIEHINGRIQVDS